MSGEADNGLAADRRGPAQPEQERPCGLQPPCCWGLLRWRRCVVPTWKGWLAILSLALLSGFLLVRNLYGFFAVTAPVTGGALVVEGWASDHVLEAAVREFRAHPYKRLYVTGVPLEHGAPLVEYRTYAERGAAILLRLGLSTNEVQAVPAGAVMKDRTYVAAVALRQWLKEHGELPNTLHLITEGPHARRSRLLFERAFAPGTRIGVTAVPGQEFDPHEWWRFSAGFRIVTGEAIAYLYARFISP